MSLRRPHNPQRPLPELEREILKRWDEREVFRKSLQRREGAPRWVFWEGPPTANGKPGAHHILSRVFKDIYPRFKTMRGYRVERKGGWDCHGLPVEIAVEQQLGLRSKADIERYGIAEFNERCRESVFEYVEDWNRLTERIGFWIDLDSAYRTMDATFIDSVWWSLRQLWDRDLLYEGQKVVPFCPRCETSLSSHELGQPGVYTEREDPSVYVRFPLLDRPGDELLVWTTTPWTLVANAAVAVNPSTTYARVQADGYVAFVAEARVHATLGADVEILDRIPGSELVGERYEPPFAFAQPTDFGPDAHTVVAADFVSTDDGTGLVHIAPAFGEDDFRIGAELGFAMFNPVTTRGVYDERIVGYVGRNVKEADSDLIEELRARGRIQRASWQTHSYPHCWRCATPLLYYAKASWYIATSRLRERLMAANETVTWHPAHVKDGRFGNWLEHNVDWALSRERYWGTPMPVWKCDTDAGHVVCIGSIAELEGLSKSAVEDPHRPFVDNLRFPCTQCAGTMTRVTEVLDCWYDSGAMPFAQYHAPFENDEEFKERWPADFVCEAIDQTRGWFYSLLAISTLLFDESPYRNVVCLGLIVDEHGLKMSKSRGNVVDPWQLLDEFGADATRWYFFTSKHPWDGYRFNRTTVGEGVRLFLNTLLNVYGFYLIYEAANDVKPAEGGVTTDLDRWITSRLASTVDEVTRALEDYDTTSGGRAISAFVDDLSNWYVRRSRRRFWDGNPAAFTTLHTCLVTVSKLLAPFCPFVADEIYDNLDGGESSVHLCDWPHSTGRDTELEASMEIARSTVALGLRARGGAKVKVRQPLGDAVIVAAGRERAAIERHGELVCDELNVKALRFVDDADQLGAVRLRPNYRTLGPRFGSRMPTVAAAIAALNADEVAARLRAGEAVVIDVDGHDHILGEDDLLVSLTAREGYHVEREGTHAVGLDLKITDELRAEGWAREVVRAVQNARKESGLDVTDRIALSLAGDETLLGAVRQHERYIAGETLAREIKYGDPGEDRATAIDGMALDVDIVRA
jgi:isoleucyl-tRNA synthetase